MANKTPDLTGKRFGKLTATKRVENTPAGLAVWECQCDCGVIKKIRACNLVHGKTKSCGCLRAETNIKKSTTHGESHTRLYSIWRGMNKRCYQKSTYGYKHYGGRGITVCDEWRGSYEAFRDWAVINGYNDKLTLDRINNDKNYCPENCRFVDFEVQENNRRNNRKVTYNGVTLNLGQWQKITGIPKTTLSRNLDKHGEQEGIKKCIIKAGSVLRDS